MISDILVVFYVLTISMLFLEKYEFEILGYLEETMLLKCPHYQSNEQT